MTPTIDHVEDLVGKALTRPFAIIRAMSDSTILVGAVAYDPKAVTIWEGSREHYSDQGIAMDFVLFSNYERQVESLLQGHIDVA